MSKLLKIAVVLLALMLLLMGCSGGESPDNQNNPNSQEDSYYQHFKAYPLTGFPLDEVPLYKSLAVDISLYSVHDYTDSPWSVLHGDLRNYYHVVYYTKAPADEVLQYYSSLMDYIDDEFTFGEQLQGMVGEYKVFVVAVAGERENTIYLSVDLPESQLSLENPFFSDYPADLVQVEPVFEAVEWTYRITSEGDGKAAYVMEYNMAVQEQDFFDYYRERYEDKIDFNINEYNVISWKDQGYQIGLKYDKEFKRTFITIHKGLND